MVSPEKFNLHQCLTANNASLSLLMSRNEPEKVLEKIEKPILAKIKHCRGSRLEADTFKSWKIKFQLGVLGGFFNIQKCFWLEIPIFEHFGSLLPARTVTVNKQ